MENLSQGIQDVQGCCWGMQVDRLKVPAGPNEYATVRLPVMQTIRRLLSEGRSVYIPGKARSRRAGR